MPDCVKSPVQVRISANGIVGFRSWGSEMLAIRIELFTFEDGSEPVPEVFYYANMGGRP